MSSKRLGAREAILSAAARLLEADGASMTLEQVAAAAGVSRQAIYLHFASRNELVLAVADDARGKAELPRLAAELSSAETPRELITRFVHIAAVLHPTTAGAQLGMEALCRTDAQLAAAWSARVEGRLVVARATGRRLASLGVLALPEERAADLLWALCGPSVFDQLVSRRGWSVRAYEEHLSRTLLAALVVAGSEDHVPSRSEKGTKKHEPNRRRNPNPRKAPGRLEPR